MVQENLLKYLSTACHPESTKIVQNGMEVLCSVVRQQKMASCEDEAMALLRKRSVTESQKLRSQGLSRQRGSMININCCFGYRSRRKPIELKLCHTSLSRTYLQNEDVTPTTRSKYTIGSEWSSTPENPISTENSQSELPGSYFPSH